jgi:acyl transferase domain-containing protein/NAD(P)H-dependent flavin oxidoreductase YrpB (nitropropane dioxygenase family)/NADP-dependent 3-hydroxy acid dehydrogenase YdfG
MPEFVKFVFAPAGLRGASLAIAGSRAGGVGVLNAELEDDFTLVLAELSTLATHARGPFGLRIETLEPARLEALHPFVARGLAWLILDLEALPGCAAEVGALRQSGLKVLAEVRTPEGDPAALELADGLLLKGNEAGGYVGEDSSFILLQKWLGRTGLPLYLRGGLTPHVAAACSAVGVAGGALESQLLLMDEVSLSPALQTLIGNLSGSETVAVGDGERGEYFRLLVRPGHGAARSLVARGEGLGFAGLKPLVSAEAPGWSDPAVGLLPIGQDACFAAPWRKQYRHLAAVLKAIDSAIDTHLRTAVAARTISEGASLARSLKLRLPIVQGPMTRVSDSAHFAAAIADGGALPMVAFALLKGAPLDRLLAETKKLLGDRSWGIGLLGFAPQALLDEQLASATAFGPSYAIIAGGRPDQAVRLEAAGVPTFLHVPSANLIPLFLQEGARRFIFEGRECGGHIGPLSSFVLWSAMVDRLTAELAKNTVPGSEIELLFAGGIHDAASSAMVQVLVAPLVERGAKVGILMGSAYLFTQEIVASGAIVPQFQQEVIDCDRTVNLESGPGHASRCAYTPFAQDFFRTRVEHRENGVPADESRAILDDLILGRLRIASKGRTRRGLNAALEELSVAAQRAEGMYMLGQVATLRSQVTRVDALHREVSEGAAALLQSRLDAVEAPVLAAVEAAADIAIVGIASVLPKANTTRDYWQNILDKVDAITEIPSHRWDWRLYFDADRTAKDKIYSKWGGFLDDMAFDPMRYGMPPKSITSVDPMQLMALEVARQTIEDAGYHEKAFDRERASVIVGASGGTGDVGSQYGLRSELPRFQGTLPDDVADRLPEWTEDSFAGILLNVIAGRIANRLNFGGVNFTTDAACASSLAAIYQGVTELVAGRSDFVVAGGVDTVQGPFGYLCFSKTQALSPRGRCSTFDASGDGIVISEGIAMVALKRLADAERDGDRIYAVIKGVGGGSDGNAKGMTAPLPAGQLRAMRRAYAMAGFGPDSVGLFEAHGTGTVAGDTAELQSTTELIGKNGGVVPRQAVIGSVKTMIGHTKATAGIAGMIKAALALHHRVLPPHRGVDKPNAILAASDSPLYLLDQPMPWLATGDAPRRAAASAFGFGGTNFHIVMEEYSGEYRADRRSAAVERWPAELLLWSAPDRAALTERLADLRGRLEAHADVALRDLAASLASRWTPNAETIAIVAKDRADLRTKMDLALARLGGDAKPLPPGVHHGVRAEAAGKLAVLFPGQGSQYTGMLRELSLHFPLCAETLSEADAVLREPFARRFGEAARLSRFIFPRAAYSEDDKARARQELTATDVAQPALGAVEVAMFRLMQALGIAPDMLAGHSYGEFVALFAGGAIDFAGLMTLSAARGRFIVDAAKGEGAELGTMAAVQAPREAVEAAIADIDGVIIANHNAPAQSIISGSRAGIALASAQLGKAGFDVTEIPVAAAFHSALVKPAQRELADLIAATPWQPVRIPVYSNTTARPHAAEVAKTRKQMAEHLVRPVEFVSEIEAMYQDGARVFLEVGPKSILSRLTAKILAERPHVAIAIDDGSGLAGLLGALAQLACAGIAVDVRPLFERRSCRIGNPDQLETLSTANALPKHAWMLNGSYARRAGEPQRQIGVTFEQAQAAQESKPVEALPEAPAVAVPPVRHESAAPTFSAASPTPRTGGSNTNRAMPFTRSSKESRMDQRRPAPSGGDPAVMAEYFETMRQFLETQERVMAAYMTGDAAGVSRALPRQRLAPALPAPRYADQVAAAPLIDAEASPPVVALRPVTPPPVISIPRPVSAAAETHGSNGASPAKGANGANGAHGANGANGAHGANGTHGANGANGVHIPGGANGSAGGIGAAAPAAVNGSAKPKEKAGGEISRDKLTDMLLAIVEEKTGYPRDMVGLDQSLESDLGIDSIKRIEVVGAMLQALPERYREALSSSRSKLNTQATLEGMLSMMSAAGMEGAVTVPFDVAGTEIQAVQSLPSRHVVAAEAEQIAASALRRITSGHFLITEDGLGLALQVASLLMDKGCTSTLVAADALASEERLAAWIAGPGAGIGALAGVIHLAAAGAPWAAADSPLAAWRGQLFRSEKSLFILLREFIGKLADDAHVFSLSALGGLFGRGAGEARGLSLQGGAVGLLKSLREERPALRVKAVDVDPARPLTSLAAELMQELELVGGRQEVGYPGGLRTVFRTVPAAAVLDAARRDPLRSLVVLATGGARGVTAETLRELALPGNTLVLTGRSPLTDEPEALAVCTDAEQVRQLFIAEVRSGASKLKPADIQRKTAAVMAGREMRANIDDFRRRGATVEYHVVDVLDECALVHLIADIESRHAPINGVVHGAGVIEDKLLADKTSESWSRVVETKVLGLLLLQRHLRPESLRFFSVFSSVAGRFGNSGQSDYATANELMNRLCCQLRDQWRGQVEVNALCWGPWGPTQFGAGMVTVETEAKFAAKGVALVSAAAGRRLFVDALTREPGTQVELVCGQGPWEAHEAAVGAIEHAAQTVLADLRGPLIGAAVVTTAPTGEQVLAVSIDSRHEYLGQHRIDGVPVLPAAAAMAIMGDAARTLWPGWKVVETRDFRLIKGVEMKDAERTLQVVIQPPPYGSSEGFEVTATIRSDLGNGRSLMHYRAVVRLEQQVQGEFARTPGLHSAKKLSVASAYDELLFHGPCFQVIEVIDGLSERGSISSVRPSYPSEWLSGIPESHDQWTFDPALVDAAAQMALLWARSLRGESCLPARFGRIVRLRESLPARMTMEFELIPVPDPSVVRANVYFLDAGGQVVLLIEEMECIASAALNRLGGTAGKRAVALPA